MANISQNVNIEMLEKLPDGTYKRKYPKTRADDGTTFDEHLAEDATKSKKGHVQAGTNINVSSGVISVPNASTSTMGATQLSTSTTSTSTTLAATPSAVRLAMNRANEAFQSASNGKQTVGNAITGVDPNVTIPTEPTFQDLATAIGSISTGKKWASGEATSSSSSGSYTRLTGSLTGYPVTVNGLDFRPAFIILIIIATGGRPSTLYNDILPFSTSNSDAFIKISSTTSSSVIRRQGDAYVTSNSFSLPVTLGNRNCRWYAFE